jgi:hypothetical protein
MSDTVMLEASMLLHRDSANYLLALVGESHLDVVVAERILEIAGFEADSTVLRLASHLGVPPQEVDLRVVRQLARELVRSAQTYRSRKQNDADMSWLSYRDLFDWTRDELATHVILEEFEFLTSESWIFSKTRQAFDAMVEAGGTAIQMSRRGFDRAVRRTLKKGSDEPLSSGSRARAAAKWVAVGGPAIVGVVEPVSGAIASAAAGYFFLVDP